MIHIQLTHSRNIKKQYRQLLITSLEKNGDG